MNILIALFLLIVYPAPCQVVRAPAGNLRIRATDYGPTQPVSATNGLVVTLRAPFGPYAMCI